MISEEQTHLDQLSRTDINDVDGVTHQVGKTFNFQRSDMDTLGIEPNTSRMLSERDNQLHHVPLARLC
jgi:hypothetical protein